ncbi:LPXTG cell wall anchor domain-containing protein [Streptomyces sp. NPDC047130]|uniref:LPXTG cell wall anchor domain-containing protein n=1 Tax=Streptomyces sp. NPDC047130 TaxID=3155261 RepID=UPI0033D87427
MKLRRAMAVAAATAVIAPLTLLSAPVAFAEDTAPPVRTQNDGGTDGTGEGATGSGETEDPAAGGEGGGDTTPETPADDAEAPAGDPADGTTPEDGDAENPGDTPETPDQGDDQGEDQGEGDQGEDQGDDEEPGEDENPVEEAPIEEYPSCEDGEIDEGLKTKVTGLPNKIVAGSGWDDFSLTVTNDTGKELDKLWVDLGVEYDANEGLAEGLAEIQFKIEDRWTDEFQLGHGFTGSFAGYLTDVPDGASITAELRIRVSAKAPAGESIAFTSAVYEGDNATCYYNGDIYEFTVLAAGTTPPKDPKPAPTTGDKPNPAGKNDRTKPQGGAQRITGTLADTGSDPALPMTAAAGAAAVLLGAGAVLAVRRRKAGTQA